MSAKGNCYDNAVVESFFGTLKCETIYLSKIKTLGGYSPVQYRLNYIQSV